MLGGGRMLPGAGRMLTGRERGGATVAGRPAAGSGELGSDAVSDRSSSVVISSSPADGAGGRIAAGGGTLRFT
ncbi:MAG: hypothetical protein BGO98_49440 [Myxococcales bacterium 68-20]|nr:MAG: hypothetical protein BGO98_49440 [Myxococcales bacterium 68-20]